MRPPGEISAAILEAAEQLHTVGDQPARGATLREIAAHACVGSRAARDTVANLTRAGKLRKVGERRVSYRNRPVAEYAPRARRERQEEDVVDVAAVFAMWRSQG